MPKKIFLWEPWQLQWACHSTIGKRSRMQQCRMQWKMQCKMINLQRNSTSSVLLRLFGYLSTIFFFCCASCNTLSWGCSLLLWICGNTGWFAQCHKSPGDPEWNQSMTPSLGVKESINEPFLVPIFEESCFFPRFSVCTVLFVDFSLLSLTVVSFISRHFRCGH